MKTLYTFLSLFFFCAQVFAQNEKEKDFDITTLLMDSAKTSEKVIATFKTTRIINMQSIETVHKRTLDFRVAHRFGAIGKNSGGNAHNLYGFDNSTDIRIAFEFGITDPLTVGLSRSKMNENLEGLIKCRLIQQTTDNRVPFAITLFANIAYTPKSDNTGIFNVPGEPNAKIRQQLRRITYTTQAIIARKFSSSTR